MRAAQWWRFTARLVANGGQRMAHWGLQGMGHQQRGSVQVVVVAMVAVEGRDF